MELLNDMALFVEVVKARGFRHAAETLGIPNSTVSRHIGMLEKAIGLRLLHRTTRKIELTEAGQIYYERCRRIVDEARLAHEQLGNLLVQPEGVLRASLPVDLANTYLAPLIVEFARRYPGITFDLDLTPRKVDLVVEPFDVAIRMGEPEDSQLIARRLTTLRCRLYAAPSYLEQAGEVLQPTDLSRLNCLTLRSGKVVTWSLRSRDSSVDIPACGRFQLNSIGLMRRLTALGQGVAVLPEEIAAEDVRQGHLKQILPGWEGPPAPVYAITETRLLPAKTQRFIEFMREHLGQKSDNE